MGAPFSNFTALRNFWKLIPRIITSDESQLGQKLRCGVRANGGEISVRFSPAETARNSTFPILRPYGDFWKLISRTVTSDESHFGQKTTILRERQQWADFGPISPRYNYRVCAFPILGFTELLETNFPNNHFRRVTFWSKTTILRGRQRWADFIPIFGHCNYDGPLFQFYGFTELLNLIFRIATSDKSHFGRKRRFCVCANGGRISARFAPPCNYEGSILQFYGFTELLKSNSANRHFRCVAFWRKHRFPMGPQRRMNSSRFRPATVTRNSHFSNLRIFGYCKSNFPTHHFRRVAF